MGDESMQPPRPESGDDATARPARSARAKSVGLLKRLDRNRAIVISGVVLVFVAALIGWNVFALTNYQAQAVVAATSIDDRGSGGESDDEATAAADEDDEEAERPVRMTTAPRLIDLLGADLESAVTALGRGATVQAVTPLSEGGDAVVNEAVILLSAEYAPAQAAQPTVVLGLDAQGRILRVGYEASMASLGYGSISFTDAIDNVGVIENTLIAAGVAPSTPIVLPGDPLNYSIYGSDGRTLVAQNATFEGTELDGARTIAWEAELSYNYEAANESGNLADTQRTVAISLAA